MLNKTPLGNLHVPRVLHFAVNLSTVNNSSSLIRPSHFNLDPSESLGLSILKNSHYLSQVVQ